MLLKRSQSVLHLNSNSISNSNNSNSSCNNSSSSSFNFSRYKKQKNYSSNEISAAFIESSNNNILGSISKTWNALK